MALQSPAAGRETKLDLKWDTPPLFHRTHRWTIQQCFARPVS